MKQIRRLIKKLWVLLLLDLRRDAQNPIDFSAKYLWIFLLCFIYGFFFKAALWQKDIALDGRTISFPLFLISGLVLGRIIPLSIKIFEDTLSQLKNSGLIEWVLVTPSSLWELFASRTIWNCFCAFTEMVALVGFARLCVGTPIRPFLQSALIQPIFLMLVATAGIGMIISGISLFLKRGNFLFAAFFQISAAFGGVFFPTTAFTGKLKIFSYIANSLPITHALRTVRLILIHSEISSSAADKFSLVIMAFVFLITGFFVLQTALNWAKKNGQFSQKLYN